MTSISGPESTQVKLSSTPDEVQLELVKLEVNVRLAEYTALRTEIVATLTQAYQITTVALTAIGIVLVASPFILKFEQPLLFLAASLFLSCLTLAELRYEHAVYKMSNHIGNVVAPALRRSLRSLALSKEVDRFRDVLTWEKGARPIVHSNEFLFVPLEISRVVITIGASLCAMVAYVSTVRVGRHLFMVEWLYVIGAGSVFLYSCAMVIKIRGVLRTDTTNG